MQKIASQVTEAVTLLLSRTGIKPGEIFVLGTSTSEVAGEKIGTSSRAEIAAAIWDGLQLALKESGIYLAVQCCEHLNRALVVERKCMERYGLDEVQAVPVVTAGGAMAAHAFRNLEAPVLVENIRAYYGMDIGLTLIGMHIKPVAVPVRVGFNKIGAATFTLAYSRPKLIGGERAVYCV
jgi:uncharacterized protein (TIGR01440 family)